MVHRYQTNQRSFTILLTLVLVFASYSYVHARYLFLDISGNSMFPTIQNEDHVLIDTAAYKTKSPARGDIIAFWGKDSTGEQVTYLKRVVGLSEETVTLHGGQVLLEDTILQEPYLFLGPGQIVGESHTFKVGADQLFVLGDNRSFSKDSRDFGPIPRADIRGKLVVRW